MDSYLLPFTIRDTLLCLVFLLGIIGGILAITRNHRKIGVLVVISFILLGIDPASEFIIFNLVSPNFSDTTDFAVFNWAYVCISSFADIVGLLTLMAAIYFAIQPEQKETIISNEDVIYSSDQ